jgi:hypothetical protein
MLWCVNIIGDEKIYDRLICDMCNDIVLSDYLSHHTPSSSPHHYYLLMKKIAISVNIAK